MAKENIELSTEKKIFKKGDDDENWFNELKETQLKGIYDKKGAKFPVGVMKKHIAKSQITKT